MNIQQLDPTGWEFQKACIIVCRPSKGTLRHYIKHTKDPRFMCFSCGHISLISSLESWGCTMPSSWRCPKSPLDSVLFPTAWYSCFPKTPNFPSYQFGKGKWTAFRDTSGFRKPNLHHGVLSVANIAITAMFAKPGEASCETWMGLGQETFIECGPIQPHPYCFHGMP